jgi:hypothetical protein
MVWSQAGKTFWNRTNDALAEIRDFSDETYLARRR